MARNNYENGKENLKTDGGFTADAAEAECDSAVTGFARRGKSFVLHGRTGVFGTRGFGRKSARRGHKRLP